VAKTLTAESELKGKFIIHYFAGFEDLTSMSKNLRSPDDIWSGGGGGCGLIDSLQYFGRMCCLLVPCNADESNSFFRMFRIYLQT
jgi:hypothetical protein